MKDKPKEAKDSKKKNVKSKSKSPSKEEAK